MLLKKREHMSEGFQKFDLWLLESKVEKFAHWWQKTTGRDCFWLARVSLILYAICCLVGLMVSFKLNLYSQSTPLGFTTLIASFPVFSPILFFSIRSSEKNTAKSHYKGFSNPAKLQFSLVRIFMLFFFVIILLGIGLEAAIKEMQFITLFIGIGALSGLVFVYYFCACDPLPLGREKSKIKQWFESVCEKLTITPQPAPIPSS